MEKNTLEKATLEMEKSIDGIKETSFEELMKEDTIRHPEREVKIKESSPWYIAATHFLTGIFIISILISFLIGISGININSEFILLLLFIFTLLGTYFSANYLNKTYKINKKIKKEVLKFSTIYLMLFTGIISTLNAQFSIKLLIYIFIYFYLFYIISKKFIKINN